MRLQQLLVIVASYTMLVTDASAQCGAVLGTFDGTIVPGNENTPFATNTGSNNRRGFRAQYLYPAQELLDAGFCAGPISCFSFYCQGTDVVLDPGPDGIYGTADDLPGAELHIEARLGTTALSSFGDQVDMSTTELAGQWDPVVLNSPNLCANSNISRVIVAGWIDFPLMGGGWNWDGVSNVIIDVSWQRSTVIGNSPPVELEEGLPYTATKWVQVTSSFDIHHGNTYQDNPLTANTSNGTTTNRPITRFNSCFATAVIGTTSHHGMLVRVDDNAHGIVLRSEKALTEACRIDCIDIAGRTIASAWMPKGATHWSMPLPARASGLLMVNATGSDGLPEPVGRVVLVH